MMICKDLNVTAKITYDILTRCFLGISQSKASGFMSGSTQRLTGGGSETHIVQYHLADLNSVICDFFFFFGS